MSDTTPETPSDGHHWQRIIDRTGIGDGWTHQCAHCGSVTDDPELAGVTGCKPTAGQDGEAIAKLNHDTLCAVTSMLLNGRGCWSKEELCETIRANKAERDTLAAQLAQAQQQLEAMRPKSGKYLVELEDAEKQAREFEAQGDMYGWNFHQGRASGIITGDILFRQQLAQAQQAIEGFRKQARELLEADQKEINALKEQLAQAQRTIETLRTEGHKAVAAITEQLAQAQRTERIITKLNQRTKELNNSSAELTAARAECERLREERDIYAVDEANARTLANHLRAENAALKAKYEG